jgi:hypothetical protein
MTADDPASSYVTLGHKRLRPMNDFEIMLEVR